jgi:hypothetical protein
MEFTSWFYILITNIHVFTVAMYPFGMFYLLNKIKNMKTMKWLLLTFSMVIVLTSCIKQAEQLPQADYELNFTKTDSASGQTVLLKEHALNMDGAASARPVFVVKQNSIELTMGLAPTSVVDNHLKIKVQFWQALRPENVAGVYNFPADNNKAAVLLMELYHGVTTSYSTLLRGKMEIDYNTATKKFSGTLTGLEFQKPSANAIYKNYLLAGWFKHAEFVE